MQTQTQTQMTMVKGRRLEHADEQSRTPKLPIQPTVGCSTERIKEQTSMQAESDNNDNNNKDLDNDKDDHDQANDDDQDDTDTERCEEEDDEDSEYRESDSDEVSDTEDDSLFASLDTPASPKETTGPRPKPIKTRRTFRSRNRIPSTDSEDDFETTHVVSPPPIDEVRQSLVTSPSARSTSPIDGRLHEDAKDIQKPCNRTGTHYIAHSVLKAASSYRITTATEAPQRNGSKSTYVRPSSLDIGAMLDSVPIEHRGSLRDFINFFRNAKFPESPRDNGGRPGFLAQAAHVSDTVHSSSSPDRPMKNMVLLQLPKR